VDPIFSNTEEYWLSIPENIRPHKDQPFYHLLAENDESSYVAYVSEQNLVPDDSGQPVGHPQASTLFESFREGQYKLRPRISH
jgi:heat shock protein HspQ